eukprot:753936-Hanusia_phi.AAC.2
MAGAWASRYPVTLCLAGQAGPGLDSASRGRAPGWEGALLIWGGLSPICWDVAMAGEERERLGVRQGSEDRVLPAAASCSGLPSTPSGPSR